MAKEINLGLSEYMLGVFDEAAKNGLVFSSVNKRWDAENKVLRIPTENVRPECSILNLKNEKDSNPGILNLKAILSQVSAPDDSKKESRDIYYSLDELKFSFENQGMKRFSEKEVKAGRSRVLAIYLFFSNRNQSNEDKPWHIEPSGKRYIYSVEDKEQELKEVNTKEFEVAKALVAIQGLHHNVVRKVGKVRYGMTQDEAKIKLEAIKDRMIEEVRKNPAIAYEIIEDKNLKLKEEIKEAKDAGLLKLENNQWYFRGDFWLNVPVDEESYEALYNFLLSGVGGLEKLYAIQAALKTEKVSAK
jgi:hypothetical protein